MYMWLEGTVIGQSETSNLRLSILRSHLEGNGEYIFICHNTKCPLSFTCISSQCLAFSGRNGDAIDDGVLTSQHMMVKNWTTARQPVVSDEPTGHATGTLRCFITGTGVPTTLPDLITYTAEAELNHSSILASVGFAVLGKV